MPPPPLKMRFLIHIKMEQKIQHSFLTCLPHTLCSSTPPPHTHTLSLSLLRVLCLQLMSLYGNIVITQSPWFIIYIRFAFWYSTFQAYNNICCQCVISWTISQSKQTAVFSVSIPLPQAWAVIVFVLLLFCLGNLFCLSL